MNTTAEVDHENRVIRICAWCCPGDSVYQHHPELRHLGYQISHGICIPCRDRMLGPIKAAAVRSENFVAA